MNKRWGAALMCAGLVGGALLPAAASAADGEKQTYQALNAQTAQKAGEPDFDMALGLAASDAGHYAEAIMAFQRVLAVQPANGPARAELARAYALAGDPDTARKEFNTVVADPTLPDPVRQRFTSVIGGLDRQIDGGGRITGFAELAAGYDSNVNTATASSSLVIPLFSAFGPATLSGPAVEQDDGFGQLTGGISLEHGLDRQDRLFVSALGSARLNGSETAFNTATLIGTAGAAHSFADRSVAALSVQAQGLWLDGDAWRRAVGGQALYTLPAFGGALSAGAQYFDTRYPADPLRDGDRASASLSYAGKTGVAALQIGKEDVEAAAGRHFAHRFAGLSAAFEYPLWGKISAVSTLSGEQRRYEAADPLFLVRRDDRQVDASFGLRVPVQAFGSSRLTLRPQVTWTNNHSNIALYQYDRVTASVALRAEF